jgi:hypothetical protein
MVLWQSRKCTNGFGLCPPNSVQSIPEKTNVKRALLRVVCIVEVAAIFGFLIGALFALVLPKFFQGPGWGTLAPLIAGIIMATLIGGYIGYRVPTTGRPSIRIGIGLCYAAAGAAGIVSYLSIFIILNTHGS